MTNPTDSGHLGHRYQVLVYNATSGSTIVADRVQSIDPTFTANLEKAYELGNPDPVGTATDPTEFRVAIEQNLYGSELELLLAGKNPTSGSSFNIADFLTELENKVYQLSRDNAGAILNELVYEDVVLADITWRFVQGGPCRTTFTLNGRLGKLYASGSAPHQQWGGFDTSSPGIIKGKDARLYLGGNAEPTNRIYRLQSFNLRATFPIQTVRELGNRELVGYLVDVPDATLDFELLSADHQPHDVLTNLITGYYDFNDLQEVDGAIRLYDPDSSTQLTTDVIKAWKLENLRAATGTILRSQVRGMATTRYSLSIGKADTSDTGGVLVYVNTDIP